VLCGVYVNAAWCVAYVCVFAFRACSVLCVCCDWLVCVALRVSGRISSPGFIVYIHPLTRFLHFQVSELSRRMEDMLYLLVCNNHSQFLHLVVTLPSTSSPTCLLLHCIGNEVL
jgi:hypothetical protein